MTQSRQKADAPIKKRLYLWLARNSDLEDPAVRTIENFVTTCLNVNYDDYCNFRYIDIRHFQKKTQERLLRGFCSIYDTTESKLETMALRDSPERN